MMTETNPFLRALFGLDDKPTSNGHTNGTAQPAKPVGEATAYGEKALHLEAESVAALAPDSQTRNHSLNVAAFNLAQLVAGGELNQSDVEQSLTMAARTNGLLAEDGERSVYATIQSGISAGLKLPRNAPPRADDTPTVTILPDEATTAPFWAARPRLQAIHDWAKARRVSPWAVLGVALTRIVAAVDHRIVIPPITGGVASLNMFIGLVGASGAGKGAAEAVAAEALPVDGFDTHRVGSGEGIAHSYMRRTKGVIEQHADACLFSVTEIDTFTALGQRQASTLIPELRSAWSGEMLGFAYADPAKRLPVPKHSYRLCLIAGVQPARAGALLNDSDGGTPQRFLWLPATDRDAPDTAPDCPPPIVWRRPSWEATDIITGTHRLTVTDTATTVIDQARVGRLRGEGDALDGHALLCRLKTAVALALLDQRLEVTDDDWDLAGIVQDVSDRTRARCEAVLADAARNSNEARARSEADRTVVVQERVAEAAAKRVTRGILRALSKAGDDGLTHTRLRTDGIASRDRGYFNDGIERALNAGLIVEVESPRGTRYKLAEGTK